MEGHDRCAQLLKDTMAAKGVQVDASDWRPGMTMPSELEPLAMKCPHGVLMHMEPTTEQRMLWRDRGTQ